MGTVKVLLLFIVTRCVLTEPPIIGGIFYFDDDDSKMALEVGAERFNFTPSIIEVSRRGAILEISEHVCKLAQEGIIGLIDGTGGLATEHVQAICDVLDLPLIVLQHNDLYTKNWSLINLYPSPTSFNTVLEELVTIKNWNNFTILYERGYSITKVQDLLKLSDPVEVDSVSVRELSGDNYRQVLINAKHCGYTNFVVDCSSEKLEQVLRQAQQVGLMADEHSYIFLSPDLFTLDLTRYRYGGVNITGFRLINLKDDQLWNFTTQYNEQSGYTIESDNIKTKILLIHDAVMLFANAWSKVNYLRQNELKNRLRAESLNCELYDAWVYGSTLMDFMKTDKIKGLTGHLIFDGFGQRNDVIFDIVELTPAGHQTIGMWTNNQLKMSRPLVSNAEIAEETIMRNKTFKVLISTTPPYGYIKESIMKLEGNDRYEGFTIDLIDRIADILGFNYEFEVEGEYGGYDADSKKWSGMVLKLREDKADFAICDFTMTAERQTGIDFSIPFMSLGIGILYKEPSKQPPEMFSFMAVFSKEVWYNMVLVQSALGVIMIFVGRISQKEWQNPVPCEEQPEELTNQFSLANSVWLIIGSVMQQGSEIAPIALAPRIITSAWWFFTMVIVASYVGILVAFLTVEKNVLPFQTVEELYNHKSIAYGCKKKGSTKDFFKESTNQIYQKMFQKMYSKGWLVEENDVGVELVENSTYAFFMESTSIEYTKERHCDLLQVGGLLDSKSYGIGMKKGSPYRFYINDALIKLKEQGEIQKLKDLWWKEKRGGGRCGETQDTAQKQLGMKNMLGAFVVLGVGCCIGLLISVLDMLWGVFKRSVKYNTTFKYELIEELKFALKFSGDIKPVKRPPRTNDSSEALAEEGKDEVKSLKSIRSGRSTDTRRTTHSHSSKHSSGGLSVAFARRREYI